MAARTTYVGLDVHKEGIVVAVGAGGVRSGSTAGSSTGHRMILRPKLLRSARPRLA
jgi:hypothetical protein